MIRLRISPRAEQDLKDIGDFIAQDNLLVAISFVERLRQRCSTLQLFPDIGRKRDELQVGYRSVTEGEYVILYQMAKEDELIIVRIIHGMHDIVKVLKERSN